MTSYEDKFVPFLAVTPNKQFFNLFQRAGVKNILISYYYIKKNPSLARDFMDYASSVGGLVMVDSGVFTLYAEKKVREDDEYLRFLHTDKNRIFSACNFDMDILFGYDKIDKWNEKFFEPLEGDINIIYAVHPIGNHNPLTRFKEYSEKYKYLAINEDLTKYAQSIYQLAKRTGTNIHGLAWTKPTYLKQYPFFSVDSVTGDSVVDIQIDGVSMSIPIEELYRFFSPTAVENSKGQFVTNPDNVNALTLNKDNKLIWSKLSGVLMHAVKKEMFKITLEGNISIDVTSDHSLISMDKDGLLYELKPNSLTTDSFLLYKKFSPNKNSDVPFIDFTIDPKKYSHIAGEHRVVLDEIFLNFLGYWVGNGHFDKGNICISGYQYSEVAKIIERIAERYERTVNIRDNGIDCYISCTWLATLMRHMGFLSGSANKSIPNIIFTLSTKQICWFLKGYYSADGSGYSASCSTISKSLSLDLSTILSNLGIIFSLSKKEGKIGGYSSGKSTLYTISIVDTNSKKVFLEKIGFLQDYKTKIIGDEIAKRVGKNQVWSKKLGVPKVLSLKGNIKHKKYSASISSIKGWRINRENNRGFFSDKVLDSDVLFLKVVAIDKYVPDDDILVYDLCVPETENFIANGVVVHNSSSWVGYQKYGSTVYFDGKEFYQYDNKKKDIRKSLRPYCIKYGVKFYEYVNEKDEKTGAHNDGEGLTFSIKSWLEVLESIKKIANFKLKTKIKDMIKNDKLVESVTDSEEDDEEGMSLSEAVATTESGAAAYELVIAKDVISYDNIPNTHKNIMLCNSCMVSDVCPFKVENSTCRIDFNPTNDSLKDPFTLLDYIIEKQTERVNRTLFMEKLEGGSTNRAYTSELRFLEELLTTKADLIIKTKTKSIRLTQSLEVTEINAESGEKSQSGGGFVQMLQNMLNK